MNQNGLFVLRDMVYGLLQECTQKRDLAAARQVHLCMISHGLDSVAVLGDHLIRLFASSSGSLLEANQVFCKVSKPSVFTWNAIILAHTVYGEGEMALDLYHKMQQKGIESNNATYTCALKASSCIGVVGQGRLLHQQIVENGVELDLVVGNALVDMYAKCSSLNEAHNVFNNLPNRSVVSWGAMFAGYAQQGDGWGALKLFNKMQQDAVEPNGFIYSCMLKGCCNIGVVEQGRLIHEKVISSGLDLDVVVGSSLIDMYAKCSSLEDAYKTFRALPNKNVVSWGAIITGFVDHGHGLPALELFVEMQGMGIKPNRVIFLCVLQACGGIGVVRLGRLLHDQIVKVGLQNELTIGSVLVEMYAKCGNLGDALRVFDRLPSPNPVAWGMLIAGYTEHGKCSTAGQYLEGMQQQGVQPSDLMYTSLLSACCHAGSFEEGFHSFKCMMESHGIAPSIEHYNCLVDLLGRAGYLEESEYLLKTMPVLPDIVGWMALLMNCCSHGNMKLAKHSFNQAVQLRPDHASSYVLMSNVYGDALRWQDVYNAHS